MKKTTVAQDRARAMRMEQLYVLDGRHRSDHPMHGLYTGLHQETLIAEKWINQFEGMDQLIPSRISEF